MLARTDRQFSYRVERASEKTPPVRVLLRARSIQACATFAKHRLSSPAQLVEVEALPLGCEVITRTGTLYVGGRVTWRRK